MTVVCILICFACKQNLRSLGHHNYSALSPLESLPVAQNVSHSPILYLHWVTHSKLKDPLYTFKKIIFKFEKKLHKNISILSFLTQF